MTKLNLIECCLLEASGELGDGASARLQRYLSMHPKARHEFEMIKSQLEAVRSLPMVELSAAQRVAVSGKIKGAVRAKLLARERAERSRRRWKLATYVMGGVSAAAAAVILVAGIVAIDQSFAAKKAMEKEARIDRATETLGAYTDRPNADDQVITNLQQSVAQLNSAGTTSTVADLDNREMVSVLNALVMVPTEDPDTDTQ